PLLPGHVLFSRPKRCGRDSKIVRDFASSDICVSLGLSQTSYYVLTHFGTGISLTFHLLARALTVERTVIGRPPSQCCQIIILQIRSEERRVGKECRSRW